MGIKRILISLFIAALSTAGVSAQKSGIKTNLIGDLLLSPNIAWEVGLAPKWTLDTSLEVNFWTVNQHKWKHWVLQPEARYWFCERFIGHFFAFHALAGEYNFGNINNGINFLGSDFSNLKDKRYQGWGAGAGIAYGYAHPLNDRWNIEAEIGIGWIHTRYDIYPCAVCGEKLGSGHHNYFGPTKLALSFVYLF